jgi:hypothetical protein
MFAPTPDPPDFAAIASLLVDLREARRAFDASRLPAMRWFSFAAELREAQKRGAPIESLCRRARDFAIACEIEGRRAHKPMIAPTHGYHDR